MARWGLTWLARWCTVGVMSSASPDVIAARVRAELARANIPRRRLARELGWARARLDRRLRKQRPVEFSATELGALARHLKVPITRFYGQEQP
jgi:transcriptional regulator with XRE-family HTH domain